MYTEERMTHLFECIPVLFICNDVHARSPVDEDGVHDSFNQLIAEQSQDEGLYDAFELQQLQKDLDEEGQGTV